MDAAQLLANSLSQGALVTLAVVLIVHTTLTRPATRRNRRTHSPTGHSAARTGRCRKLCEFVNMITHLSHAHLIIRFPFSPRMQLYSPQSLLMRLLRRISEMPQVSLSRTPLLLVYVPSYYLYSLLWSLLWLIAFALGSRNKHVQTKLL
jgi:hypothetical protein